MNAFADSIFSLLFGWLQALVQGAWSWAAAGDFSGFFTWLGDHWLWTALIVALSATVIDFVIWMIRWRPYLVWQTKIRRIIRFFRYGKVDYEEQQHFREGYQDGVALEMPQEEYTPDYTPQPAYAYAYDYGWEQDMPPAPEEAPLYREEPAYSPEYMQPSAPVEAAPPFIPEEAPAAQYFAKPQGYEPPPVNLSTRVHGGMTSDMPAARRKRRSDKYDKHKASWHQRLISDDEEEHLLDGLPPAVDKNQAFHQPVYPQHSDQIYAAWQRPGTQNQGMDQQA